MRKPWRNKRSAMRQNRSYLEVGEMEKISDIMKLILDKLISQKESGQNALLIFTPTKLSEVLF